MTKAFEVANEMTPAQVLPPQTDADPLAHPPGAARSQLSNPAEQQTQLASNQPNADHASGAVASSPPQTAIVSQDAKPSQRSVMSEELVLGIVLTSIAIFLLVHSLAGRFTGRDIKIERLPSRQYEFKIDINTATEIELLHLPGIGPSLAKRILEHRQTIGSFQSLDQLSEVKGLGPKTLESIRPYLVELKK